MIIICICFLTNNKTCTLLEDLTQTYWDKGMLARETGICLCAWIPYFLCFIWKLLIDMALSWLNRSNNNASFPHCPSVNCLTFPFFYYKVVVEEMSKRRRAPKVPTNGISVSSRTFWIGTFQSPVCDFLSSSLSCCRDPRAQKQNSHCNTFVHRIRVRALQNESKQE